jgi:hypothetical protein
MGYQINKRVDQRLRSWLAENSFENMFYVRGKI